LIVVDTSAVVAIFLQEAEMPLFLDCLASSQRNWISAASVLECSIVIRGRKTSTGDRSERWLDDFLVAMDIQVEPVLVEDLRLARDANLRFGKGTGHPAQLNFGDCFAYALAKRLDVPLLYKGDDFARTDIAPAL
jgi:ribonuclease VapC